MQSVVGSLQRLMIRARSFLQFFVDLVSIVAELLENGRQSFGEGSLQVRVIV